MNNLSLLAIMRNDPEYAKKLEKRIAEVKQDKTNLLSAADKIAKEHAQEIEEGTRKKALLLAEGEKHGCKEEDVMQAYGRFLPTKHTPILNLIYFILKEEDSSSTYEQLRKEFFEKFGHEYDGLNKDELEQMYGKEEHTEPVDENVEDPPSMEEFIYGEMSHDTFKKIKKLKTLSLSDNEHEAFLAYRACMKLCEKYGLDFNKVPCYTDNQKKSYEK